MVRPTRGGDHPRLTGTNRPSSMGRRLGRATNGNRLAMNRPRCGKENAGNAVSSSEAHFLGMKGDRSHFPHPGASFPQILSHAQWPSGVRAQRRPAQTPWSRRIVLSLASSSSANSLSVTPKRRAPSVRSGVHCPPGSRGSSGGNSSRPSVRFPENSTGVGQSMSDPTAFFDWPKSAIIPGHRKVQSASAGLSHLPRAHSVRPRSCPPIRPIPAMDRVTPPSVVFPVSKAVEI